MPEAGAEPCFQEEAADCFPGLYLPQGSGHSRVAKLYSWEAWSLRKLVSFRCRRLTETVLETLRICKVWEQGTTEGAVLLAYFGIAPASFLERFGEVWKDSHTVGGHLLHTFESGETLWTLSCLPTSAPLDRERPPEGEGRQRLPCCHSPGGL